MSKAERDRRYRDRHSEECKERDHQRYLRQRDKRLEKQTEYYKLHREEILYKKRMGLIR